MRVAEIYTQRGRFKPIAPLYVTQRIEKKLSWLRKGANRDFDCFFCGLLI